ncbi:Carbohydrate binding family 6 [Paenibacillus curdlanolyticus YK9]|uniref:Carbohydrate binding family 6 n=1 Tax=Paenibacillus curdlanolyticus YK9 TaxID=717606 RepID=E0I5J5_9BACL|nr:beta-1,3-glucanase family protein [Paenibacillus curdlanolyticus]EFM12237.1 Carbohydrate binding family 6 [Paenibacillus curdlanolyticus YK9]
MTWKRASMLLLVFALVLGLGFVPQPAAAAPGDPGKIEAESYAAMNGIQTETCTEGGLNVGYIEAGDWMDYTVNVQTAGTYSVDFRVSSPYANTQLQLLKGATTLATVTNPNTGGWQNWQTVSTTVNLTAGSQTLRVYAASNGWNLNWINITSATPVQQVAAPTFTPAGGTYNAAQNVTLASATAGATIKYTTDGSTPTAASPTYAAPINVSSSLTIKAIATKAGMTDSTVAAASYTIQTATGGKAVPGKIEAESYDAMFGVATEQSSEGGLNVGWIETGDSMSYNVSVATAGAYTVQFRVASPNAGGQIQLRNGATVLGSATVSNTGGWQTWSTVTIATGVNLAAGSQTLTVYAAAGGFNLNWLQFTVGAPTPKAATPTFSPVGGGTYATAQNVTLATATAGAVIKYTTDGTTPTAASLTYTGPITVATTTSVKAIAIKSGMADSDLASAAYKISKGGGAMDFQIKNGTRGNYADNQIYWAVLGLDANNKLSYLDANGNLVPTSTALNDAPGHLTKNGQNYANIYHKLSDVPIVSTPAISSGRMFLSVGSPMYIKVYNDGYAGPDVNNPTDPNNDLYWDFIEFTLDAGGYHGNTTRVDAFGFPITHRLITKDGYDRTVGETETRANLFAAYLNEVPAEFKTLVQAPYRILAPAKGGFKAGGPYANYFDNYVNQVWTGTGPKPTTQEILLGIGAAADPQLCAALNRGVYPNPAQWTDTSQYYKITPSNYYSKFWHDHSIDGLSYGFCYDDVYNQAAYLERNDPLALIVTVGW